MKKKIILSLCVLLVIAMGYIYLCVPISLGGTGPEIYDDLPADTILTANEVEEDRNQLVKFVESTHPFFAMEENQTAYEKRKEEYIKATEQGMSLYEFWSVTGNYLAFFEDGHTRIWWMDNYYDIYHRYEDGHIYYYEYVDGMASPTELYICAINGVPIERIFSVIDESVSAENEYASAVNYNQYINSESVLKLAGADVNKESVEVLLSDGSTVKCPYHIPEDAKPSQEYNGNTWFMDHDVFVMNFTECTKNENFNASVVALKQAIENGCNKVIIDVRNNGGGNSSTCTEILETMRMKAPRFGTLIRYSEASIKQNGYLRKIPGIVTANKPKMSSARNSEVELVVLCNKNTFSSATMMCTYVRDGGLGLLIGEPSSNSPSSFGQPVYISLNNSHLYISVSHKYFTRPNGDTTEKCLVPDVVDTEDAYAEAMKYFGY